MNTVQAAPGTKPEDMRKSQAWLERYFSSAAALPIAFTFGGEAISGIPAAWGPRLQRRNVDANIAERVYVGQDPASGLQVRVECTEYKDYPVVEWVAWFTNTGDKPTPLLEDILAMDAAFDGASPVVYHCNGDYYSEDGYTPTETALQAGGELRFAPNGGRPCDGAFPYYRLTFADGGHSIAVGWPAQWMIRFQGSAEGVQVQSGQEKTHLRLLPGESIRTPRMTVLTWAGDSARATNLWRRWYLAHILPRPDGRPLRPLLACAATDEGEEFTAATEENQIRFMDTFKERGFNFDVWWIDAGWYPCYNEEHQRRWWRTGSWMPDPERFPRGLQPISDRAAEHGADLLVWFEPERVQPSTALDLEHDDWLLRTQNNDNGLLYLGNPEARQWLTDHVCQLIRDNGIKIYRQDHNFPPLDHWRKNDAEDRQGMNENLHVQGYLQFWDDLLARNPGLWIDSCASGGRRNDLETMRRSVPLHYTDYGYGDHPVKLAFHRTLYEWIPYFKECTLSWDIDETQTRADAGWDGGAGGSTSTVTVRARFDPRIDSYSYHCGMAPMVFATLDIRRDDYDFALATKMIDVWRRAAPLHALRRLLPAYTLPYQRQGVGRAGSSTILPPVRALSRASVCPPPLRRARHVYLQGIDAAAQYRFENMESGETREVAGDALIRDGFTFALPRA